MSLEAVLDAIAVHGKTISGIKASYATTAGSQGSTIKTAPNSVDDTPILFVFPSTGDLRAGNTETFVHTIEGQLWVNAQDHGYAYKTIIPFVDLFRVAFRSDIDANGTAARVLMTGYREPRLRTSGGATFLVLPLTFSALEMAFQHQYAV